MREIILNFIHKETGLKVRPRCSFEDLYILSLEQQEDKSTVVTIKYHFDEDGFSMYDKTHTFEGKFTINECGVLSDWFLVETETGVAAVRERYVMKTNDE